MIEHFIFIFFIIIFISSTIGYGLLFSRLIFKDFAVLNYGYQGIIGFFTLCLLSIITSYFTAHNFIHNTIIHVLGLTFFFINFIHDKEKNFKELKLLFIIILSLAIGLYIFKNHDDFPYYHLTYALNLSENKFMIGTGSFSHGFRTSSSIFYYHSLLYLPYIKYYLFHSGPFLILIFFNYILLTKIITKYKKNEFDIIYYLSILNFIFIDVVFYRIAEHGADRSAQIILILLFIIFLELLLFKKKEDINLKINLILIMVFLASSMKALFYIYLILVPIILFKTGHFKSYFEKKNFLIIIVLSLSLVSNLSNNFFSTGCFLYPEKKTCIESFDWSISKEAVSQMKTHYEWWAKAGGGPGYSSEIPKEIYVKNFNWTSNWIERHFFNKISDTLFGILFIGVLCFLFFYSKKKKKVEKRKTLLAYLILLVFFVEWFLNHPSMRYGGFVLFALPVFIFFSEQIEKYDVTKKKVFISTTFLIFLTLFSYNLRNYLRIDKEINLYNYKITNSPFFNVVDVDVEKNIIDQDFIIYTPLKNMCWAAPTPCSYNNQLDGKKLFGINVIINN
jgi:hypothetical protein